MTLELLGRLAALEGHVINLAVARDFDLEPIGKRVDAFRADAVQTAGIFVSALAEFSARVQIRQDQLDRRHLEFRMHIDRNAAAVVAHGNRAIDVNRDVDLGAISGEMFVDRVVENFENASDANRVHRGRRCTCRGASGPLRGLRVCRSGRRRISGIFVSR